MKTVYLHIGTFKTGSSSIQEALVKNREELKKRGYFVPEGQLIGHHELPLSLIIDYTNFRATWPDFDGGSEKIWKDLQEQILSCEQNNIIISSENFCDLVNEHVRNKSGKFEKKIREVFSEFEVKVFCYIREIMPYTKSMFTEVLKISPNQKSFDGLCNALLSHDSIHLYPSKYLSFFEKIFGKEAIFVYKYDKKELLNQDIVGDFFYKVGLDDSFIRTVPKVQANTSIPNDYINMKRIFNTANIINQQTNRHISNILKDIKNIDNSPGLYLSEKTISRLTEKVFSEQDNLNKKYNLNLSNDNKQFGNIDQEDISGYFLIGLTSYLIKQVRLISDKSDRIERKIDRLLEKLDKQ